ncbi:hypothetical protein [Streptomyces sp. NPDC046870]|uniref:hypothetical protein n=1 Tax=Streptomyces sp. NPDC046870 TaxID=3155135 RepID=UPI003456233A
MTRDDVPLSAMMLLAALDREGTVALSPAELGLLREWLNRLADAAGPRADDVGTDGQPSWHIRS